MASSVSSLVVFKPNPLARIRIFCFHYAGGSANVFRGWPELLPSDYELVGVQLPGRENRLNERLLSSITDMAASVGTDIIRALDRPFLLFGYSLGALLAFEIGCMLHRQGGPLPRELIVAAAKAPQLTRKTPALSTLPDDEFIFRLRSYGGTPESVLLNRSMMDFFLPMLRADMAAVESYRLPARERLRFPITAIGGSRDASISSLELAAWKAQTAAQYSEQFIAGGHFFIHTHQQRLIETISQIAKRHLVQ